MKLLARATAGLWIWAIGFSLLYALHGIGCARGWDGTAVAGGTLFRWATIGFWLLLCAAAAMALGWARRQPAGLQRRLTIVSALAGFAATIITGMPVALTSACL